MNTDDINIYKLYVESSTPLDPKVQKALDRIETIDGEKVIQGDVFVHRCGLRSLPFHGVRVTGSFTCCSNKLTTLEGAPSSVGKVFHCTSNQLTTLKGAPTSVGISFLCSNNQLTSLKGAPTSVGGDFDCRDNLLTTLEGAPTTVGKDFACYNNPIATLEGSHISVGDGFRFGEPITIKQIAASNIHAREFLYTSEENIDSTFRYDFRRDEYNVDVTDQVNRERHKIRYNTALSNELSGVEDAINIADIDF